MSPKKAQLAGQIVTVVLAFAVGLLVGQQFCAETIEEVAEVQCPEAETEVQMVEYCPPEPEPEVKPDPDPPRRVVQPATREPREERETLPEGPPPTTPQQRRELLGWARSEAASLQSCPRDMGATYRVAVTLRLNEDRSVREVTINSDDQEITPGLKSCIRERILRWQLPEELHPTQERLVFSLTL